MRRAFLCALLLCICFAANAQKENNVWVGGLWSAIDFNSGSPVVFVRDSSLIVNTSNASISDTAGNLLFYSNGFRVYNRNYELMQNGDSLDIGDYESWGYGFNSIPDGSAIVPLPGDTNRYYIFYLDLNYNTFDTFVNLLLPTHLMYGVVDITLDGGLGGIVPGQKDIVILSDTLTSCGFKMVKHANGRDYWLLAHEMNSDVYFRFLIDPYGIHGPYTQQVGESIDGINGIGLSTLHISEHGNVAAQLYAIDSVVRLYDFDRCTGTFSNPRFCAVPGELLYFIGAAFSPSGRYLYVSAGNWQTLWQFDLSAVNITASRQLIAEYDGTTMNPFPTNFYQQRLAPDGKIYIHSHDWNNSLHVINYPDSAGAGCGFVANGLTINPPGWNWRGFPNIVNYSLDALVGSGCDTLTSTNPFSNPTFTFGVHPNPFVSEIQVNLTGIGANAVVEVTDVLGRVVHASRCAPVHGAVRQTLDLSHLVSGVYMLSVEENGERQAVKIVKH